jgi:hypothetical protein
VVGLGVPDHGLDGLAPSQPSLLLRGESLGLAAVDDFDARHFLVYAPVAQVDDGRGGLGANALQQRGGLLDLAGLWAPVRTC